MNGQNEIKPHIRRNFDQLFKSVEWSLSMTMTVPALVLLYSAIDIAAGLASEAPNASGKKPFVKWVNRYLTVDARLACTALDLYGARCGLVHGFGAASTLSQNGKAKQILYAQGDSDAAKLREIFALSKIDSCVVVHAADLFKTVRAGVEAFLDDARSDSTLLERINRNARFAFESLSEAEADELLRWGKEKLNGRDNRALGRANE